MKCIPLLMASCLFALGINAYSESKEDLARHVQDRAKAVTLWRSDSQAPFEIHAAVRLHPPHSPAMDGTYSLARKNSFVWREELHFPEWSEVIIRNHGELRRLRTTLYEPLLVSQVRDLIGRVIGIDPELAGHDEKRPGGKVPPIRWVHEENGVNCVNRVIALSPVTSTQETCFSEVTGIGTRILSSDEEYVFDKPLSVEGSTRLLPQELRYYWAKNVYVEMTIDKAIEHQLADSLFDERFPSAQVLKACDGRFIPPVPIKVPDPEYPDAARRNRLQGRVSVVATVGVDGRVSDEFIAGTPDAAFKPVASHALSKWSFQPATCDGAPMPFEIRIQINFHLY